MQEYLQRSRVREVLDGLGLGCLTAALCLGWFIFLWGPTVPALLSGTALFFLLALLRRATRDGRLRHREKTLRRRIGGEMALDRLLLCDAEKAHFEVAMLLSLRLPLTLLRSGPEGVVCLLRNEKVLLSFLFLPVSGQVSARDVLLLQRETELSRARRGILCAPCAVSQEARDQAENGEIPVSFFSREELIDLFGRCNPATDAQLVALGQRRKQRKIHFLPVILNRRRAGRYAAYGALLLGMYVLSGLIYYAVPGLVCVCLASACRCVKEPRDPLLRE